MKSVKAKILTCMIATSTVFMLLLGTITVSLNRQSSDDVLTQTMQATATETAAHISYELKSYKNVANCLGLESRLTDPETSLEEKQAMINQWAESYGFTRGNLLDRNGRSVFDGKDFSDRAYFAAALQGKSSVSTPVISKVTGLMSIIIAAPVWQDGKYGSTVAGCVYLVPEETFLNDIMTSIHISEHSGAYMIDQSGYTIADTVMDTITTQNIEEEAKSDSSLKPLAAIHAKMRAGESGMGNYTINGAEKLLAYAPVAETDGWSIGVSAPHNDFLQSTILATFVTIALAALCIIVATIIAIILARRIGQPIQLCTKRIELLARGDMTSPIPEIRSQDETGALAKATKTIVSDLRGIISDMDYMIGSMAAGNFNVKSRAAELYTGDYETLLKSIMNINQRLNGTLAQINTAAGQVAAGSDQVSSGAQALAQGATQQASAVEQLSATINDISEISHQTARISSEAKQAADSAGSRVRDASGYISQMNEAMQNISASSEQIGKIIATIENIAFQTNILALNAAVEAARAGTAGKGFAVVADEVRNLASKSDEAAKATKELIESSITAVKNGAEVVEHVTEAMNAVVELSSATAGSMDTVAQSVDHQSEALTQITQGIDQISSVVQTNSATAQQSAAASEQLSGQSEMLKNLVRGFTLRE